MKTLTKLNKQNPITVSWNWNLTLKHTIIKNKKITQLNALLFLIRWRTDPKLGSTLITR